LTGLYKESTILVTIESTPSSPLGLESLTERSARHRKTYAERSDHATRTLLHKGIRRARRCASSYWWRRNSDVRLRRCFWIIAITIR